MESLDWIAIGAYFSLLLGVSLWVIRKRKKSAEDYFLAGRNLGWFVVGASIFASNIGSEHLVGLAASGATDGVAMAHYELHAWCLLVLGWVLAPFFMRSNVYTMPEFLERRFNATSRVVLSLISLFAYVLTKIAVGIFAGGIVFAALLPEISIGPLNSFWVGSILMLLLTGAYTITGGLRAVAYTEAMQTFVLILGSALVTWFGLSLLGDGSLVAGWAKLREVAGSEAFNLWKPITRAGAEGTWAPIREISASGEIIREAWYFNTNYPWLSMLFCAPVIGLWYWCTDQYIVQRMLGARDEQQARRGTIFAASLKLLPVFIFIIPGMIAFALAKSGQVEVLQQQMIDPLTGEIIRANAQSAFPLLVQHVLPTGFRGIVVAGLLAALMSSLAGVLNASATLFTMDLYSRFRSGVSQERLVWVGRVATAVLVVIGLLWIPVIQGARGLYDYLQGVQAYLAPPIFVVFFFGVFFKRLNGPGCLATLLVGFLLGLFRLVIDTPVSLFGHSYAEGSFFWVVNNMFFQYYSILILLVCIATFYIVSYTTRQPDFERISGLTYGTLTSGQRIDTRSSWGFADVFWSGFVIAAILAAYLYFRG